MKKKPITVEDLWKLERAAQPTLSPDGAQACVSVTSFDMEQNVQRASLWLLSAFGGEPRRLTSAGEKNGEPRWSPDGRWIAFVAKRPAAGSEKGDEEPQVYAPQPEQESGAPRTAADARPRGREGDGGLRRHSAPWPAPSAAPPAG